MISGDFGGLSALPLQDVVFPLILPLLTPQEWCILRAVDRAHQDLISQFLAANRHLELAYCKQLTEPALLLLSQGATCLRNLTLSGCKLLTDEILRPILKASSQLRSLDLSECHHLTSGILQTVTVRCPKVSRLILRDCHWVSRTALEYHCTQQGKQAGMGILPLLTPLEKVGSSTPSPSATSNLYRLQEIDLTGCWELDDATVVKLLLSFPRLSSVKLGNIYSLTDLTLRGLASHSRCLVTLDIRGCWRTTDQGVSLVGEYCQGLASLAVHDCRDITEQSLSRLRQKGVLVDRKLDPIMMRLMRIRAENRHARVQI